MNESNHQCVVQQQRTRNSKFSTALRILFVVTSRGATLATAKYLIILVPLQKCPFLYMFNSLLINLPYNGVAFSKFQQ